MDIANFCSNMKLPIDSSGRDGYGKLILIDVINLICYRIVGIIWTHSNAFTTMYAFFIVDDRFFIDNPYSLCRAFPHAVRTAFALVLI